MKSPLHRPSAHESAHLHVTGQARYVADEAGPQGTIWVQPVVSPVACGRIIRKDGRHAREQPGVLAVVFAEDLPGERLWGPIQHTEPFLADERVEFLGQPIALVFAEDEASARQAASAVVLEVEVDEAILSIEEAIARDSYLTAPHRIARGDLEAAFSSAYLLVEGELHSPGQDHFYLETQAALVIPEEDGTYRVRSSTQHPSEVQKVVAGILGISAALVVVEVPRLGGGFGGKESQAGIFAAWAALGAQITGRACRICLHRHQDMAWTGKRHPFFSKYRAAFDRNGRVLGYQLQLWSDGGWSLDLSGPVLDRALFHADSAYYLPAVSLEGRACKTNLPSNTAFRGFGGPQGMLAIEEAMDAAAPRLGLDPIELRLRNLYADETGHLTPFGQSIGDNRFNRIVPELLSRAALDARREAIARFNEANRYVKRGIGFMPVKFGISFTASLLNQAGALVLMYTDGSVQVNHGGTEMGQGLHTKIRAIVGDVLGVAREKIRLMVTSTEKVPNTSATAASSGTDLNGAAVLQACTLLRARLSKVGAELLGCEPEAVQFGEDQVSDGLGKTISLGALAQACWVRQVSLSATGYYATPGIAYDAAKGQGKPFFYFTFGAALAEVEVSGLTGEHHLRRVDILQDCGDSLVPNVDRGQVEGAFVQGQGWLTSEELRVDGRGRLLTEGPSTYKIPSAGDVPFDFRVELLERASNPQVVGGSKAVGEPPFMLALSVVSALRAAIASFGGFGEPVELGLPATPEAILRAIFRIQAEEPGRAVVAAR